MSARSLAMVLVVALAVALRPGTVHAHGRLVSAVPAEGARLDSTPRELRLTFSERPELGVSAIELIAPDGHAVPLGTLRAAPDTPRVLVTDVRGTLAAGEYEVRWRIAGADGHPVRGSYRFEVTGAAAAAPADTGARPTSSPASPRERASAEVFFGARSPLYVAIRWITYVALVLTIGAVSFAAYVLPRTWVAGDDLSRALLPATRERVRQLAMLGATALVVAAGFRLPAQLVATFGRIGALDPVNVGAVLATRWGSGWILQVAAALLLLATLALARTHARAGWTIALVAPPALALASAIAGHAAAIEESGSVAVALDALHVLAASTWFGGLAALIVVGLPAAAELPLAPGRAAGALVNAFSPVALLCGVLVVLSGSAQAVLQLGSLGALASSSYGRVLLVKLALVLLVLGAGAFNWRRVRPQFEREDATDRLRTSGGAELAVALGILLVTAVLVAVPPPR